MLCPVFLESANVFYLIGILQSDIHMIYTYTCDSYYALNILQQQ